MNRRYGHLERKLIELELDKKLIEINIDYVVKQIAERKINSLQVEREDLFNELYTNKEELEKLGVNV